MSVPRDRLRVARRRLADFFDACLCYLPTASCPFEHPPSPKETPHHLALPRVHRHAAAAIKALGKGTGGDLAWLDAGWPVRLQATLEATANKARGLIFSCWGWSKHELNLTDAHVLSLVERRVRQLADLESRLTKADHSVRMALGPGIFDRLPFGWDTASQRPGPDWLRDPELRQIAADLDMVFAAMRNPRSESAIHLNARQQELLEAVRPAVEEQHRLQAEVKDLEASPILGRKPAVISDAGRSDLSKIVESLDRLDLPGEEDAGLSSPALTEGHSGPSGRPSRELTVCDRAAFALYQHITNGDLPNVTEIARELDVSRQYLYECKDFMSLYQAYKGRPPRGSKDRDRGIEATWQDD